MVILQIRLTLKGARSVASAFSGPLVFEADHFFVFFNLIWFEKAPNSISRLGPDLFMGSVSILGRISKQISGFLQNLTHLCLLFLV